MDTKELIVQENIANWQSVSNSLAPLTDDQMELVYEISDFVKKCYSDTEVPVENLYSQYTEHIPIIYKIQDYICWMVSVEKDIKYEELKKHQYYYKLLLKYQANCKNVFACSNDTIDSLDKLKEEYQNVTEKTNYLHDLSEQLMTHQRMLKEKKTALSNKLRYFTYFNRCQEWIEMLQNQKINSSECVTVLVTIDESISYLNVNLHFKESRIYKMKYVSLLTTLLNKIYVFVNTIIVETTKQVIDPDAKINFLPENNSNDISSSMDSAFSLYYGKFQSVSTKVSFILNHLEECQEKNDQYKNILGDCQKTYITQRLPILSLAVSKALNDLKVRYKNDYSILFRSCCTFVLKVCQDEAKCYNYFFKKVSDQFSDYLGTLSQYLYDILRPSLITIDYIEVLSELCGILKEEILSDRIIDDKQLLKYVEVIKQLLQDIEERLVFRANVFFQRDLNGYKPCPGDLAYPEKLEQMENIALELKDKRSDSTSSIVSQDLQEVAHINAAQMAHFRSYTGNSPADLHGMWYPTVKRTLVCLSRLYFCLDRNTFQGLAQEALVICIRTVEHSSNLISLRTTPINGHLFQIKHLLIIREQIAPFQVDFTAKEMALDFSSVQKAAIDLIHHRNNIFSFGSNNALLEFLLEGTPKVKEYLVDSRKEIDKQLKNSCEAFISYATQLLIGKILNWMEKAKHILKIIQAENEPSQELTIAGQDFGKATEIASIISECQKNMKTKIPEIQRSMQLYLANRETEFILFRPIKNNIINGFMQLEQILDKGGYSCDDLLLIACLSPDQINVLICSVSLTGRQENVT